MVILLGRIPEWEVYLISITWSGVNNLSLLCNPSHTGERASKKVHTEEWFFLVYKRDFIEHKLIGMHYLTSAGL